MGKSLIIVESPTKIKTLKNFLGDKYRLEASMGHVRDLPKSTLGVDVEHDFAPEYRAIPERKEVIKKLKEAAKSADEIFLASDPDREGEAISWHLQETLKAPNVRRIEFNEITKDAVLRALEHPRTVDMRRVNAQQARRVLDRLVGYKLSPLVWHKVRRGLSAGRVQSVAVRLVCEREREIQAFVPDEFWTIIAKLTPLDRESPFDAKLIGRAGKKLEVKNETSAKEILAELKGADYSVSKVSRSDKKKSPAPPFITSTLQQEASRKMRFSNKRTMLVAQQLYEGVELGTEGSVGLISYMRTDSTRIAEEALLGVRDYITATFGDKYVPSKARYFRKAKAAQDAHEAIRPTSVARTPESVAQYLSGDQLKLYKLIWQRFVACQMAEAVYDVMTVDVLAKDYLFRATGARVKFDGFTKVYTEGRDEAAELDEEQPPLPPLAEGQSLRLIELVPDQHFTQPPPRYTEATLVRTLEEKGIGRPSTYAAITSTIQDRGYVELIERKFHPTELGFGVNDLLVKHFPDVLDVSFTASVESQLDKIEDGEMEWVPIIREFYEPFSVKVEKAHQEAERVKFTPVETEEVCPNCGRKMVIREGRYGKFLGCSGYPECKTIVKIEKKTNLVCPTCGEGQVVEKRSKKKKLFYGCNRYPDCKFVSWTLPVGRNCPKCGSPLVENRFRGRLSGVKCSKLECDYKEWAKKQKEEGAEEEAA